jgi:hypothetical protein
VWLWWNGFGIRGVDGLGVGGAVVGDIEGVCGGICDVDDSGEHGVFCVDSFVSWIWQGGVCCICEGG